MFVNFECKWTRNLLRMNREGIPKLVCDYVSINVRSVDQQKLRMETTALMKTKRRRKWIIYRCGDYQFNGLRAWETFVGYCSTQTTFQPLHM